MKDIGDTIITSISLSLDFRFDSQSEAVDRMSTALFGGTPISITPLDVLDGSNPPEIIVAFHDMPLEIFEEEIRRDIGMYIEAVPNQNVMHLGTTDSSVVEIIETLDAGFVVYLLPQTNEGRATGLYTLFHPLFDNC